MGGTCCKNTTSLEYDNFCPLRIATLYADIDESINTHQKIETIVEYFMKPHHGWYVDVLCIQGIRSVKILKELISCFKRTIDNYNDTNRKKSIYLEYFPDIDVDLENNHESDVYWSTSESINIEYYDKLVISRHSILQSADVQIGSDKHDLNNSSSSDSDEVQNMFKYVQIVNLNVDGTYISIYNVDLEDECIGISNVKERKKQLRELKEIIEDNRQKASNIDVRQFVYGDNVYVACNRNIHIVVGAFHINEIKNGSLNSEYVKMCTLLNAFDIHRWVSYLRKDTFKVSNVKFTKDIYTLLISNIPDSSRSQKLYEEHKMVVINSIIAKNIVDMNQFTNYPEDTLIMLYRPNIDKYSNNYTHRFLGQIQIEQNKQNIHPKYGASKSVIVPSTTHPDIELQTFKIHSDVDSNLDDPNNSLDCSDSDIIREIDDMMNKTE